MKVVTYRVRPNIPEPLKPLEQIAANLWFSWHFDAVMLFIRLDYDAWIASNQNPAHTIGMTSQERLDELSQDDSYLSALTAVYERLEKYRRSETWYQGDAQDVIAYFSMEYGLDKSLPIYSGGLGILSGDHLKTSSDIGLPLVGIGLLYRQGYFQQFLNSDGYQQESYPEIDWYMMPVRQCLDERGAPQKISVLIGDRTVAAAIWEVTIGRTSLYLLDTNIPENLAEDRLITATLYGGDRDMRIRQEILLGIGGVRALAALGIQPKVFHMNEGHSAFLALERMHRLMQDSGLSYGEAFQIVWASNVFTTHTPVPAGNERFEPELMLTYFETLALELGLKWEQFMALGREKPDDELEHFCMTVLALRFSAHANGVSRLHGSVSRAMWKSIWPALPVDEVPITHITNGVHPRTWISHSMIDLLDRYFGPRFHDEPANIDLWKRMDRISDEELWRTHERRRERLVVFARSKMREQLTRSGATSSQITQAEDVLSPYALTISFARRFATYKRATLLFRDPERLVRMLSDIERPVQLIFAGKAHPHDIPGKDLIRDIIHFSKGPEVRSRIIFLEDYDMTMAKYLISGADLWMNTPRRPQEASGTSGMKAAINGVLNLSVRDGWWDEGYSPEIGWAVGGGASYDDEDTRDEVECQAVFDLLEREVIPTFYDRGRDGLPRDWIGMMKSSMATVGQQFCSCRMVMEYIDQFYAPAIRTAHELAADGFAATKELAAYLARVRASWPNVSIRDIQSDHREVLEVGDVVTARATVELGGLAPQELRVELYDGRITSQGNFEDARHSEMELDHVEGKAAVFRKTFTCAESGRQGYSVRVLPGHRMLAGFVLPSLIKWA